LQDLRISLLDRCNFRCPYCMPEAEYSEDYQFLTRRQRLSHDEIFRVAAIAVDLGVTKLRLTGGEPLLDKKVAGLIGQLSTLKGVDDLALTTNGVLLAPSLDSMDEDVFRYMSGDRGELSKVLEGIEAAEKAGLDPIKINVVVQRGVNDHTVAV
jgi:cyclic pyranopterin phosphate synthase